MKISAYPSSEILPLMVSLWITG